MTKVAEQPTAVQASHAPGPLSLSTLSAPTSNGWINEADGSPLATVYPGIREETREIDGATFTRRWQTRSDDEVRATAERMVRAYNCHDELLAALKAVVKSGHPSAVDHPTMYEAWELAGKAIAKAEGRS